MRAMPWILVTIHTVWLLVALALRQHVPYPGPRPPEGLSFNSWHMGTSIMVAGRDLHHDDVSWPLMLIDIPALALAVALLWPLDDALSPMAASYAIAAGWLIFGGLWWFLIGKAVSRLAKFRL
jgi:hypothetical protein